MSRRGNKRGAVRTSLDGYSFASKLEASVYAILKLRMKAGEFTHIQPQDHVYLTDARIGYVPDFKCTLPDGSFLWIEAKGMEDRSWRDRKKLWAFFGPGPLEIWMGSHLNPKMTEKIIPGL